MAIPVTPTQAQADAAAAAQAGLDIILAGSSEKAKESQERIKEWSKAVGASTVAALGSFESLENALGAIIGRAETGTADFGIGAIKKFVESVESKSLVQGTKQTADFIQEITGMNALAIDNSIYGINSASKQLSDAAYKTAQDYSKANITLLSGVTLNASTLLGDAKDLYAGFKDAVLDDTRLFNAGIKGMSYDILENIKLTGSALKMQPRELNEIFHRELSATGVISGDMLKTYEKTVLAVGQATGQVPTMIAQDLSKMLNDFNHFGALTIPQMGSLAATLHQMGLEINDVTKLADNFSSFDKAVQTMSNLSATTGATLDTLGLFQLANTDQEQFIISLRDQLDSQGVEFENMNILQQKQIASAFGIDPIILQRLLSDNFDTIESANAEIEGRVSEMSDETMRSQLADMGGLVKAAEALSSKDLIERQLALENASAGFAKSIENSFRSTVMVTDKAVDAMDGAREKALAGLNQIRGVLDDISSKGNEIFSKPSKVKDEVSVIPVVSSGPAPAPPVDVPSPQPAPATDMIPPPTVAPAVSVPSPPASTAATAPASVDASAAALNLAKERGRLGVNQTTAATVSPTSKTSGGAAAQTTAPEAGAPAPAPAAEAKASPAPVAELKLAINIDFTGGGTELGKVIAKACVPELLSGVNSDGVTLTFTTNERTA